MPERRDAKPLRSSAVRFRRTVSSREMVQRDDKEWRCRGRDRSVRGLVLRAPASVPKNGRSGYAEEEDHEQDCERTVSLEPIDGHE
jgi:hypothetical protein